MQTTTADGSSSTAARPPAQLTQFVGRARELADVQRLLSTTRLLTLTGVGGSGKTRLAIEIATSVEAQYPDGLTWIELGPLTTPALVPTHVAAALGMRETPAQSAMDMVVNHLRDRAALVVLDNCEHVVEACATTVDLLMRNCPRLTVLATSREALGVTGERAWLVPPLSLPAESVSNVEAASLAEAVQLFVDRAHSATSSFILTDANVPAVVRICRRLDGIPLAIELAAARARVLSAEQIADRLEDSFRLLSTGSRTVLPRHRTLRETIDWSYALLTRQEQVLLHRLAVFTGGFTLEAVEAICAGGSIEPYEVLDTLSALVDKSLVAVHSDGNWTRYRLLETVRQYALEHLDDSGETSELRMRHARYFLDLAEDAAPHLWGGAGDAEWMSRLVEETDNLRAFAEWTRSNDPQRVAMGLRLGVALHWFLFARGWFREGRERMARALDAPVGIDPLIVARAHTALASIALWQGDTGAVPALIEPCIPVLKEHGDRTFHAYALSIKGAATSLEGYHEQAGPILAEAVDLTREQPVRVLYAITHYWQGVAARARGDFELAHQSFSMGVAIGRELNHNPTTAHPLNALGRLLVERNQLGDATVATTMLTEALEQHRSIDDRWGMAWCLEGLAGAAQALGNPQRTVKLMAAANALREMISAPLPPSGKAESERRLAWARDALGEGAFAAAWVEGSKFSLSAALEYALGEGNFEETAAPAAPEPPRQESADLRVQALGPLRVLRGDLPLDSDAWRSSKARELLLFLLCHPQGVTREQIGLALWADATAAQLRNNFHVTMHRLRKGLGDASWIEVSSDRYRIAPHVRLAFDVLQFQNEVNAALRELRRGNDARAQLSKALELYRGDLLDGERIGDWHMELRDHLQRLLRDGLRALGARELAADRFAEAAAAFERLVAVDSYDEEAYRQLLVCYARMGDRSAGIRLFQKLVKVLRDELDSEPEPETAALFQRLQHA